MRRSRHQRAITEPVGYLGALAGGALVVGIGFATAHILAGARRIHEASRPGREVSAQQTGTRPLTSFRRTGAPGDPLNVQAIGTDGQLGLAFASAGWYRADEITLLTSLRISVDSVLGRRYSSAPVSNLYLYGRKEDYAFERPGKNVRQRDHVRFWDAGQRAADGRPIWTGGATQDIKIELSRATHLPTHGISPDVDQERDLVADELTAAGWVSEAGWAPGFGQPTQRINGDGFPYHTDGRIAALTLADVPVPPLFAHVRGPLIAGLARRIAPLWRHILPERALRRRQRANGQTEAQPAAPAPAATNRLATPPVG